jgi:hypothetical protein
LLPSPPLESFPTFVESLGVLDPTIFEQTQALHYFSPIPGCGLQTPSDQSDAQHTFVHTILYPKDALAPRKAIEFFFHRTTSHPLLNTLLFIHLLLALLLSTSMFALAHVPFPQVKFPSMMMLQPN